MWCKRLCGLSLAAVALTALHACSGDASSDQSDDIAEDAARSSAAATGAAAAAAVAQDCAPDPGIEYVCGPLNAEDIVRVGDGPWLLTTGMDGTMTGAGHTGHLYLVHAETGEYAVAFPGEAPRLALDTDRFGGCPGPLDLTHFSMHGAALHPREGAPDVHDVYVTNHGARESVEVFELDARGDGRPAVSWIGCVPMPESAWTNAVAVLPDGGLVVTKFVEAGGTIAPVFAGEITGHVLRWRPGGEVEVLPGTEMSGANGVLVDERYLYVAEMGRARVLRFELDDTARPPEAIALAVNPDNLRWTDQGSMLTVGPNLPDPDCTEDCATGWSVYEIDPDALTAQRIGGVGPDATLQAPSTALRVDNELWIGTYAGDRLGILADR